MNAPDADLTAPGSSGDCMPFPGVIAGVHRVDVERDERRFAKTGFSDSG